MVEATATLRRLSEKVSKLNKSSDDLNKLVSAYEEKLADMKIGVEVWVNDPEEMAFHSFMDGYGIVHGESFVLATGDKNNDPDEGKWSTFVYCLGYCKIGDAWRIAVKSGWATMFGNDDSHSFDEEMRIPLAEASRNMRINALGAMEKLFKAIEGRVDKMLNSIEAGKKFIKSID
jgi:hypothetical protein